MIDEAEIWFTAQVAEYLRTPATTIRWWRHIGQGPKSFKLGARKVAYLRRDVEAWLQRQYAAWQGRRRPQVQRTSAPGWHGGPVLVGGRSR